MKCEFCQEDMMEVVERNEFGESIHKCNICRVESMYNSENVKETNLYSVYDTGDYSIINLLISYKHNDTELSACKNEKWVHIHFPYVLKDVNPYNLVDQVDLYVLVNSKISNTTAIN